MLLSKLQVEYHEQSRNLRLTLMKAQRSHREQRSRHVAAAVDQHGLEATEAGQPWPADPAREADFWGEDAPRVLCLVRALGGYSCAKLRGDQVACAHAPAADT